MKLSVIITHYHTPDILKDCLDAIKKEIKSIDYEIIVADGDTDKKIINGLKEKYPDVLFVENAENIGFSRLVNRGIEKAQGEFLFVINADINLKKEKDVLDIIDYMDKNPDVGIVGPRLFNIDGSVQQTYFREYTFLTVLARRTAFGKTNFSKKLLDKFTYKDLKISGPFNPDWMLGAAFFLKKDRLEKIGGRMDERFFMYFEDADLCRRFKKAGFKVIYYPFTDFIHHHIRASDKGRGILDIFTNRLTRVHIASYLKYLWKWNIEKIF